MGSTLLSSRLLINHSLLPLSYLPRGGAGEKIEERSHVLRRVFEATELNDNVVFRLFNTLLDRPDKI
jgi:hypothetical protein